MIHAFGMMVMTFAWKFIKRPFNCIQCAKFSLYMQASNYLEVAILAHQELPMASPNFAGAPAAVNPLPFLESDLIRSVQSCIP